MKISSLEMVINQLEHCPFDRVVARQVAGLRSFWPVTATAFCSSLISTLALHKTLASPSVAHLSAKGHRLQYR